MDRLVSMQVFVKVAELGGFSAAAQRLELSKSSASKHILELEQHLGLRLFHRTTRKLSLTEAGARYYEHCVRILEDIVAAERSVSSLQLQPRGVLRVSVPVSFGLMHLAPVLPAFSARHPELAVDMVLNDRFADLVDEGFDAAIRITELQDSSLMAHRIAPAESWLCASPEYLARRGVPASPEALAGHDCLLYSYGRQQHEWRLHKMGGCEQRIPLRGRLRVNNGVFLLAAAERGLGIVFMPDFIVCEAVRAGRLVRLLDEFSGPPLGIYAVYPATRHVTAKVRVFIDFLIEHCGGDTPPWRHPQ